MPRLRVPDVRYERDEGRDEAEKPVPKGEEALGRKIAPKESLSSKKYDYGLPTLAGLL